MKNCDYWKSFVSTGKVDDYLHYIACTKEESSDELIPAVEISVLSADISMRGKDVSMHGI